MTPQPQPQPARVKLATGHVTLDRIPFEHDRYDVTLIRAGPNRNDWTMPREVLARHVGQFAGAPCQIDHHGWFEIPSLLRTAGTIEQPAIEGDAARAVLRLNDTPSGRLLKQIFDAWLADQQAGLQVADVGLSAVLWCQFDHVDGHRVATSIELVESVDAVLHPAAGGRVERMANSFLGAIPHHERSNPMPEETPTYQTGGDEEAPPSPPPAASQEPNPDRPMDLETALATINRVADQVASLTGQVDRLSQVLADREAERTVTGLGSPPRDSAMRMGRNSLEQVDAALEALLAGVTPPDGVRPLTGIRELYHLLSGDYEMTGRFHPDRVYLANVTSSTMAALVANRLNKVVVNTFQQYPKWWIPIVTEMDFATLQDARWITLGGIGELPTVSEGAAYTELTWDDNTETAAFVKKGGYLGITIEAIDKDDTRKLRMAPMALAQAAWLTLSKSLSTIFTANAGVGPTLADAIALFNGSHSNLGSTALSHTAWVATRTAMRKQTELNSAERLGALTAPRFLLVPPDLEVTGLQVLATEHTPGSANYEANPFAQGDGREARLRNARSRVVVVDLWTDTDNWAAVADPNLYPSIAIGYRYGRTPEIFSVADPSAGLMFSNDVMPVKVRFFYATGPTDHRGLYKHNVG